MRHFERDKILSTGSVSDWTDMMELAVRESMSGAVIAPKRMHLDHGENSFLLMPCVSGEYWVSKLVSFCPGNKLSGNPSIYGTVLVCSSETGKPLAIMDGGSLTAMRTAAVSAMGMKYLAVPGTKAFGIIGTGYQGLYQSIFAASILKIEEIWAYDPDISSLSRFSSEMSFRHPGIKIKSASDSSEVARNSDLIVTATNSVNPVFEDDKSLFAGKTFIGIGSYKPGFREFPEQLFRQLDQVFVDTTDGITESGDLITPLASHWIDRSKIHSIGSLLTGEIKLAGNTTRLFKTVGNAVYDLYAARLVLERNETDREEQ